MLASSSTMKGAAVLSFVVVLFPARTTSPADDDAFPAPHDTQAITAPMLSPPAALAALRLPDGFSATLFAAEPDVRQPIAMAFDARGRLWVAENYTYAEQSVNHDLALRDRIVVFEDRDGDGVHDARTVFWDQAQRLTSVELGFGGVWALCPPALLFIPDADGDDVPDGEPVVLLDGWSPDATRHNFVNGLRWGPDGWLYGRHGIMDTSHVGAPGTPREHRTSLNCGIWRFHPTRHEFEVVCHGTTNSWGADWDDYGQLFFINTVIGHLWHALPGAHYERMYGADFNPHVYELIAQTADHYHWDTSEPWNAVRASGLTSRSDQAGGGHAHTGMMIYLGDQWPGAFRGDVFTLNFHGRRANRDRLERRGAGYVGRHEPDLFFSDDVWFRGIELSYGPDGAVYVLDWSDLGECHENDGVHRGSGRIFKIAYGPRRTHEPLDLSRLGDRQLAELQLHPNDWFVRVARRILQERAARGEELPEARQALFAMFSESADVTRQLRAMWSLELIGALDDDWLRQRLGHSDEHVRVWAIRLLAERHAEAGTLAALADRAAHDPSGLVLAHVAAALQRLAPADRWAVADALVARDDVADDRTLSLMMWYAIEPLAAGDPGRFAAFIRRARIPRIAEYVARRTTHELESRPASAGRLVDEILQSPDTAIRQAALEGMAGAVRGWRKASPPAGWDRLAEKIRREGTTRERDAARELSVVFGDGRALEEVQRLAADKNQEIVARRQAIRAIAAAREPDAAATLARMLGDRDVVAEAVRALGALGQRDAPRLLLDNYAAMHPSGKDAAVEVLAQRPDWAGSLLAAVESGGIAREHVPPHVLRQIQLLDVAALSDRVARLWPELRLIAADKLPRIAHYRTQLTASRLAQADRETGRHVFRESCAKCHKLFGEGGDIGPDLSGSQRTNLNYLLENIVDPSATLAASFRMSVFRLDDGRVISGVPLDITDRTLSLQTPTERVILDRETIVEQRLSNLSLMPDGLLDLLEPDRVRDLVAYLMSE